MVIPTLQTSMLGTNRDGSFDVIVGIPKNTWKNKYIYIKKSVASLQ